MSRAAKRRIWWAVALALVAIAIIAGITAPAEGSIPRSVDDASLRAALAAAEPPVATSTTGYRLLARASAGYGLLPRASARAGSCLSGKRHIGAIGFLAEAQRPGIKGFSLKLSEGVCDGPSMYQFAGNDPVNNGDPLGLENIGSCRNMPAAAAEICNDYRRQSAESSGEALARSAEFGMQEAYYGSERLTELPNDLINLPGNLGQAVLGLSGAAERSLDCLINHTSACFGLLWDNLKSLPNDAADEWVEYTSRPAHEHARDWGRGLADSGVAMVPLAEVGAVRVSPRAPQVVARLPTLRQQYVEAVDRLATRAPGMRSQGRNTEKIARTLHAERRALGVRFKAATPLAMRVRIYFRNYRLYGDRLGPSVEWLREHGKTWEDIIESASRSGGKDLGL